MTSADSSRTDDRFLANAMASFLQIAAVVVLVWWCFNITRPFISIVVWGLIIAVAIYPVHVALTAKLGGREKSSATLLAVIGLAIVLVPSWILADSTYGALKTVGTELQGGTVKLPPPEESVADWPLIGNRVYDTWSDAATNLEETLNKYQPQLQALGGRAAGFAAHTVGTIFQFVFSIIIAATLLMSAKSGYATSQNILASLAGTSGGERLTNMSILTIRSVFKGVLGVAIIQTLLAAIGLMLADIPAAGLWAFAVLVVAIIQLPPIIVLGPIAFWYFSVADGTPATIFLIYAIVVSSSDMVLKPMLLGRGVETPMLVILIGAIGGAITSGIIGLFIGAVVLALGYELLTSWMAPDETDEEPAAAEA